MHICSLGKIDWVKNFLNFHNSGRQTKLKSMTSNSHSPMDDLESEDNTTANPNELDLANCEGENANRNRQGGAAKKKQLIMKAVIYMYIASAIVLIGCIY